MKNLNMFCITLNDDHLNRINSLGYTPVGLGKNIHSKNFLRDNTGNNIAEKNPYYGEYTFHYWLWKNYLENIEEGWIGFCQYRKFWVDKEPHKPINEIKNFKDLLIKNIPDDYENSESIIGEPFFVNQFRFSKFIKHNLKTMIKNPILFINKNKRTLKFHFDMMHGHGNLSKAVKLLDMSERKDFTDFLEESVSFNPHNMFICKSKKILKQYYESIFPWLERCEKVFGFDLDGYGLKRIYGFLAERYMSYWFQKYTKYKLMPIYFKDISDFK